MMQSRQCSVLALALSLMVSSTVYAEGFSWQINGGEGWTGFSNSGSTVWLNPSMQNQYSVTEANLHNPIFGVGAAYTWDFSHYALALGGSFYYMASNVSGVNTQFVNSGNGGFGQLSYTASGKSYAVLLEPKIILTASAWQPYLLTGLGVALNRFGDYQETVMDANGSAVPTLTPFSDQTNVNFAYEMGVGIQHVLDLGHYNPTLALEYRYMDWGHTDLGNAQGQSGASGINFGHLTSNIVALRLSGAF